jgi:hypothetical protein
LGGLVGELAVADIALVSEMDCVAQALEGLASPAGRAGRRRPGGCQSCSLLVPSGSPTSVCALSLR